jgi:hypothetical protein
METIMVNKIQYRVEKYNNTYILHGPRGACYGLVRSIQNPHHMFTVNLQGSRKFFVNRLGWFTDENGELKHLI